MTLLIPYNTCTAHYTVTASFLSNTSLGPQAAFQFFYSSLEGLRSKNCFDLGKTIGAIDVSSDFVTTFERVVSKLIFFSFFLFFFVHLFCVAIFEATYFPVYVVMVDD